MSFDSLPSEGKTDPGSDIIPEGARPYNIPGGCRAIRCETVGTFIGVSGAGVSRTVTFYQQGEVLVCGFRTLTGGTGVFSFIM